MGKPGLEKAAEDAHEKLQTFIPADHGLQLYSNGIGVTEQYLSQNPQVVRGFVRAALKGWKFALDHPAKAAQDELQFVQSLKPEVIAAELDIVRNLVVTPDTEQHGLGWFDPAQIKANVDFVTKYIGVTGTPPAPATCTRQGSCPIRRSSRDRFGRSAGACAGETRDNFFYGFAAAFRSLRKRPQNIQSSRPGAACRYRYRLFRSSRRTTPQPVGAQRLW